MDPPVDEAGRSIRPAGTSRGFENGSHEFEAALRRRLVSNSAHQAHSARPNEASGRRRRLFRPVGRGLVFGFQIHALLHQPTGVVLTAMLLPLSWDDRRAVRALAPSTGGEAGLGDRDYSGEETFDWPCGQAQTLRAGGHLARKKKDSPPSVRYTSGSKAAFRACGGALPVGYTPGRGAAHKQVCC